MTRMRYIGAFLILLLATAATIPVSGGADRVDEVLRMARTALAATPIPTSTAISPSPTPVPPVVNACDQPPPWTDLSTAQRCYSSYPMPLSQPLYRGCPAYLGGDYYLICSGYYLAPAVSIPSVSATATPLPYPGNL